MDQRATDETARVGAVAGDEAHELRAVGRDDAADVREPRRVSRRVWRRIRMVDKRFVPLFVRQAVLCVEGLEALVTLLRDVADPGDGVRRIEALEKQADRVVDEVRALLRHAWWPPFSSSLVLELCSALDDILDLVEDAAESLHLYHVTAVPADAQRLADLALEAGRQLKVAVEGLSRLDDPRGMLALCAQVDALEAQADHIHRTAMSRLFREEPDARQLIKSRAIYQVLEELTDRCKDAAGVVEAIVLRYA